MILTRRPLGGACRGAGAASTALNAKRACIVGHQLHSGEVNAVLGYTLAKTSESACPSRMSLSPLLLRIALALSFASCEV